MVRRIIDAAESKLNELSTSKMSGRNLIRVINANIVSVLRYTIPVVEWSIADLDKLDKMIRRSLVEMGVYGKKMVSHRLYLPLSKMGLGLMSARTEARIETLRWLLKMPQTQDEVAVMMRERLDQVSRRDVTRQQAWKFLKKFEAKDLTPSWKVVLAQTKR